MASSTLDGSAFSFTTTKGHTTHISILWVLVLFSVLCVAIVLLAGYQEGLQTRKFGDVDVDGNLKVTGGITTEGSVNLESNTTLSKSSHAGRLLRTNDADGVFTLPSITSSDIGAEYNFVIETAATGAGMSIKTDGTDKFFGYANMLTSGVSGIAFFSTSATDDVITMNGSTTGGEVGSTLNIRTVADGKYFVEANLVSSGIVATPFSAS